VSFSAAGTARMTAAEYLAMERAAPTKHERWNGEVYAMAGASLAHNLLVGNLIRLLGNLLLDGPCIVLPSDMKVHVPATDGYVYPDVTVVCGEPELVGTDSDVIANPRLVVEVLSESSERFDRGEKFAGYRSLPSVMSYLLVAQDRVRVEHYEREAESSWVLREHGPGARLQLRSVEGSLEIDEIYRKVSVAGAVP
jgi:Uma2 family endonuclease